MDAYLYCIVNQASISHCLLMLLLQCYTMLEVKPTNSDQERILIDSQTTN